MNNVSKETIGFVGMGIMGRPMALNLHQAGYRTVVYNRSKSAVEALSAAGLTTAASPEEVARTSTIVFIMVSDTDAVEKVLLGEHGIVTGLRPGSLVVDMGTSAVARTRRFAQAVRVCDCDYLDAPVSGGEVGAREASLTIMVGGSDVAFRRATPLFEVLGRTITHVGEVGAGQVAKAANQIIVGLTIGAVAEALTLAKKAGVDAAKVRTALKGGFAWSRVMELHGQRMIDGKFEPGGKVVTQRKDLAQALELAEQVGVDLPATRLNRDLYDRLIDQGGGNLDHSALVKVIDR